MKIFSAPDTTQTADFYSRLMRGKGSWVSLWNKENRFDVKKCLGSPNVRRYFTEAIAPFLSVNSVIGDFGCGAGIFLPQLAARSGRVVAIDSSPEFVDESRAVVRSLTLANVEVERGDLEALGFNESTFDVVVLTDVIHHLKEPEKCMGEVRRVLKPGGRLLVFEPNLLNPALFGLCLLDKNEWGALALGRKAKYRMLLAKYFCLESVEYSGLLIGPSSKLAFALANLLCHSRVSPWLGWLSPKIFLVATKPASP